MNGIKEILKRQTWVKSLLKNEMARTVLSMWHSRLSRTVQKEIKHFARSGDVDHAELIACNFAYEVSMLGAALREGLSDFAGLDAFERAGVSPLGCTTCAILDFDEYFPFNEHVHFGRNFDWPDPDDMLQRHTMLENRHTPQAPQMAYDTVTFPGFSGVFTGFSKGRFAVAMNAVLTDEPPKLEGASPAFLLREVLEKCATFEEAVKILSETPLLTSVLFTVASSNGFSNQRDAVVIERSPTRFSIRYPEQVTQRLWVVAATNTTRCLPSLELEGLTDTSCARYDNVMRMAADYEDVSDILDESDFGLTIYSATADLMHDQRFSVF